MSPTERAMIGAFVPTDKGWRRHAHKRRGSIPIWSRTWICSWSLLPVGVVCRMVGHYHNATWERASESRRSGKPTSRARKVCA